ncbi:MAG: hypothetical protein HY902_11380 [Deltaproteobacteria bacterium]|nr:hypothetical protein [Deltaproteobacteria bacterium]
MALSSYAARHLLVAAAIAAGAGCGAVPDKAVAADVAVADAFPADAAPDAPLADAQGQGDLVAGDLNDPADAAPLADSATQASDAADATADVTEVSDAGADALPDSDAPTGDADAAGETVDAAIDAGPQVCFHVAPPGADAWVADVPAPAAVCAEVAPPEWFDGQPLPPPTLDLKVGWRDAAGAWHPYNNGDWVPLLTANQGGFHVELVPVATVPGQTAAALGLQLQSFTLFGCEQIGNAATAMSTFVQTTGPEGEYTLDPAKQVFTIFGTGIGNIDKYCGIWIHVYWRVRVKGSNQWGEAVRLLRTYNSLPAPKG